MKIVSVWNPKGGQGKSPIAINLAAAAHAQGKKAIVICRDPQGTSTLYFENGNLPFDVLAAYPKNPPDDTDFVIVDHSADDWTVPPSPIVVIPTKPERPSFATFSDALAKLEQASSVKRVIQVVTDTDYHIIDQIQVAAAMKRAGAFEIRRSASLFAKAGKDYLTFYDRRLRRVSGVYDRRREINAILAEIEHGKVTRKQKERAHA